MRATASSDWRACRRLYSIEGRVDAKMFGRSPSRIKMCMPHFLATRSILTVRKSKRLIVSPRKCLIPEEHCRTLCRRRPGPPDTADGRLPCLAFASELFNPDC